MPSVRKAARFEELIYVEDSRTADEYLIALFYPPFHSPAIATFSQKRFNQTHDMMADRRCPCRGARGLTSHSVRFRCLWCPTRVRGPSVARGWSARPTRPPSTSASRSTFCQRTTARGCSSPPGTGTCGAGEFIVAAQLMDLNGYLLRIDFTIYCSLQRAVFIELAHYQFCFKPRQ